MCGIFGAFNFTTEIDRNSIQKMGDIITHRGPDDSGIFNDQVCAIGNRRLSIIDIAGGAQPIFSKNKEIVIVQNGEIYNYLEIQKELEKLGVFSKGIGDTETILSAYLCWGDDFVKKLNGMFAIAIYDKNKECLKLFRDRLGQKPLYMHHDQDRFLFASEIKSILELDVEKELSKEALHHFLSFNFTPLPYTFFKNIYHVLPGEQITITKDGIQRILWWKLSEIEMNSEVNEAEVIEKLGDLFDNATKLRLRADVEVGAFLSGGVDSSAVVEAASRLKENSERMRTYSIGFKDPRFDESRYAKMAADLFNTNHVNKVVDDRVTDLWPKFIYHCDQPHGDISFIPTFEVASLATKDLKVVLTGDGGDELFAGYDKYKPLHQDLEFGESYFDSISLLSHKEKLTLYSAKWKSEFMTNRSVELIKDIKKDFKSHDSINQALALDSLQLLPGNNLVKPDRMGMAVSIEARMPFMDYRMIEYAFSLPGSLKIKDNETKYILKKTVEKKISKQLAYRDKQMFTVPIGEWFKNELANYMKGILLSDTFLEREIFDRSQVLKLIEDHLSGQGNHTRILRALIAIEHWFRKFID